MSIVVTGATGPFGRHVVESLLERGVPAGEVVAGGRSVHRLDDLAARGVRVARLDYDDPQSIADAVRGATKVLIVSGNEFGKRVQQHVAVARAAKDAGARHVLYTSAPYAQTTPLLLAGEHAATEVAIQDLGIPFTFLRNSWYFENYTAQIPTYVEHGAVLGAAGDGRISGAPRAEYAQAAAAALTGDGHEYKIYELGGDTGFTLTDLAESVGKHTGADVAYRHLTQADFAAALASTGMPEPVAQVFADVDRGIAAGELFTDSGDLSRLLGRPTTPLDDAVAAAGRP